MYLLFVNLIFLIEDVYNKSNMEYKYVITKHLYVSIILVIFSTMFRSEFRSLVLNNVI